MNCRSFRKRQAELLDACPDRVGTADLIEHAAECSECARELSELRAAMAGSRQLKGSMPHQRLRSE